MNIKLEPDTPESRWKLNQLAREQMKLRLMRDICFDINVCRLEGWDYKSYLNELQSMIEEVNR